MPHSRAQGEVPERSFRQSPQEHADVLPLTVLYTGLWETLEALREAAGLAFQLQASIRILVIQVVPYPLPVEHPRVDPEFRLRQFRSLWKREPVDTKIDICLCRDGRRCLRDELPPNSIILIGGHRTWWPFTREERTARFLRRAGHQVIRTVSLIKPKYSLPLIVYRGHHPTQPVSIETKQAGARTGRNYPVAGATID